MQKQSRRGRVNWPWVREWAGRVFLAAFMLIIFGYLSANPAVFVPGGVMRALPTAIAWGAGIGAVITAITAAVLAVISTRRG